MFVHMRRGLWEYSLDHVENTNVTSAPSQHCCIVHLLPLFDGIKVFCSFLEKFRF